MRQESQRDENNPSMGLSPSIFRSGKRSESFFLYHYNQYESPKSTNTSIILPMEKSISVTIEQLIILQ